MARKYGCREYLTKTVGLTENDLEWLTRNEVFDTLLEYEGFGRNAGDHIRQVVKHIYDIDLTHYEEYLDRKAVAEMDDQKETSLFIKWLFSENE